MNKPTHSVHPLWALYQRLAMGVGLVSLVVICLGWLPLALVFEPLLPRASGQRLGRHAITWGLKLYLWLLRWLCACRFDLSELDQLRDQGPLIIAANHPSLLDALLLVSRLPNAVCVMKASLMDHPLFGAASRLARYVRNDVPLRTLLQCREALAQGGQLVIFPEGTRTRQFPINPCQPVIGMLAQRCHVPVQTLLIEFSTPYLGKHWPLWRPPALPLHARVRLGQRFAPPTDTAAFTRELQDYFESALRTAPHNTAPHPATTPVA